MGTLPEETWELSGIKEKLEEKKCGLYAPTLNYLYLLFSQPI
jgi:hypothetical protein